MCCDTDAGAAAGEWSGVEMESFEGLRCHDDDLDCVDWKRKVSSG